MYRIGRTGRCGNVGRATSFYDADNNKDIVRSLINILSQVSRVIMGGREGVEGYVHKIGRTGRCGNVGRATSFYDADNNKDIVRSLIKILSQVS